MQLQLLHPSLRPEVVRVPVPNVDTLHMDTLAFVAVSIVTVVVGVIVARMTRGITFSGVGSDNGKQVRAASLVGKWRWPSDMHKYGGGKTRMKDTAVLGIVVMQRMLGDRVSEYPLITLCVMVNSISAVLLFLVATTYWTQGIGLLVFALFITSFWSYLLALFGGPICVAQMFFLASVYLMQNAETGLQWSGLAWYFASGVAIGCMLFSSGSSRKYLPLLAGAFFYSQRQSLWASVQPLRGGVPHFESIEIAIIFLATALALGVVCLRLVYRRIVAAMYFEQLPSWLNRVIEERSEHSLGHYVAHADRIVRSLIKSSLVVIVYFFICLALALSRLPYFYYSQIILLFGICAVVLLFTYPNVLKSLRGYFDYWNLGKAENNRFNHMIYRDFLARIRKPHGGNMRGAGLPWIIRYFSRW